VICLFGVVYAMQCMMRQHLGMHESSLWFELIFLSFLHISAKTRLVPIVDSSGS
jgi:hypothetical protein